MKTAFIFRKRHLFLLLLPVLLTGIWLGGKALPELFSGESRFSFPQSETIYYPLSEEIPEEETLLVIKRIFTEEKNNIFQSRQKQKVVIYCTHASEEYLGQSRINGKAGGVMAAAAALKNAFQELGVEVIFDETVHDHPRYDLAYESSLKSLENIAAENPDINIYIDVHRDSAIAGISTTLAANNTTYAKMMLVIGSDENLPHPNWQQNQEFAQQVTAAANQLQPGIMREPRLYNGRYNQHIAENAILVEIGSNENSEEEACRSARILAEAIISCM